MRHPAAPILAEIEEQLERWARALPHQGYSTQDGATSILMVTGGRGYQASTYNMVRRFLAAKRIELGDLP